APGVDRLRRTEPGDDRVRFAAGPSLERVDRFERDDAAALADDGAAGRLAERANRLFGLVVAVRGEPAGERLPQQAHHVALALDAAAEAQVRRAALDHAEQS